MKLVSANRMIFSVLEKACENDALIVKKIWGRNTWANYLLKLLAFNDLQETQLRNIVQMSEFSDTVEFKISEARAQVGYKVSKKEKYQSTFERN